MKLDGVEEIEVLKKYMHVFTMLSQYQQRLSRWVWDLYMSAIALQSQRLNHFQRSSSMRLLSLVNVHNDCRALSNSQLASWYRIQTVFYYVKQTMCLDNL